MVTRRRLLEAAAEVFAEQGFRNATIHEICSRAGANIAAAHYHFGDKEALYAAVFDFVGERVKEEPLGNGAESTDPEARLRLLVTAFLTRLLGPGRPAWIAQLLAREMIEPTPALDRLVRERMRANHEQFGLVIRELLGAAASADAVRLCVLSVVAQCVFYRNSAPIIGRLYPDLLPARDIERLADHITRFSLAAMHGLRRGKRGRRS